MAIIKPFKAYRPRREIVSEVAALPYDVYNREEAKKEVGTMAEGVNSVQSVYDIARKNHLNTPIIDAVWQIVCQGKKPHVLLQALGFIHRGNK